MNIGVCYNPDIRQASSGIGSWEWAPAMIIGGSESMLFITSHFITSVYRLLSNPDVPTLLLLRLCRVG
jgi:hypothetical protein